MHACVLQLLPMPGQIGGDGEHQPGGGVCRIRYAAGCTCRRLLSLGFPHPVQRQLDAAGCEHHPLVGDLLGDG